MANGICDVPNCEEPTYMGWRALTEKVGKQICEYHWNMHKTDRQYLYDAFGIERPFSVFKIRKFRPVFKPEKQKEYCVCGEERQPGHKYCSKCIAERKREQRKKSYHRRKKSDISENSIIKILICRSEGCQNKREPNHKYCSKCAKTKRRISKSRINHKYYIAHRA